jgi:hypothetical protein
MPKTSFSIADTIRLSSITNARSHEDGGYPSG